MRIMIPSEYEAKLKALSDVLVVDEGGVSIGGNLDLENVHVNGTLSTDGAVSIGGELTASAATFPSLHIPAAGRNWEAGTLQTIQGLGDIWDIEFNTGYSAGGYGTVPYGTIIETGFNELQGKRSAIRLFVWWRTRITENKDFSVTGERFLTLTAKGWLKDLIGPSGYAGYIPATLRLQASSPAVGTVTQYLGNTNQPSPGVIQLFVQRGYKADIGTVPSGSVIDWILEIYLLSNIESGQQ